MWMEIHEAIICKRHFLRECWLPGASRAILTELAAKARLDDTQALDALVSSFRSNEKDGHEKEKITRILAPYESAWC